MKKIYILGLVSLMSLSTLYSQNQKDSDSETNIIEYNIEDKNIKIKAGGRVSLDAAHYINDKIDMSSNFILGEARLNTFASFGEKYDVKIELDFAYGKVSYKDIFARWNINKNSSLRIGHYVMPFSLDRVTSSKDVYFISNPGTVNALTLGRKMGASFRMHDNKLWGEVGAFTGNAYQEKQGDAGWGVSGRFLFNPEIGNNMVLHIGGGVSYRTPEPNGFDDGDDDYNRYISYQSNAETNVDKTNIIDAFIEHAETEFKYNAELLFVSDRFMFQSEYTGTLVTRQRDNQRLFEKQLGGMWSFQTLEAWEKWYGKGLRNVSFKGIYAQVGFLINGDKYTYDRFQAISSPSRKSGSIEVLARFDHTDLNDVDGIWYAGRFYKDAPDKGPGVDDPNYNYSIGGGRLNSWTLGVNYYFNKYARMMFNYGYQNIDSYTLQDKYAHTFQARLQISF